MAQNKEHETALGVMAHDLRLQLSFLQSKPDAFHAQDRNRMALDLTANIEALEAAITCLQSTRLAIETSPAA